MPYYPSYNEQEPSGGSPDRKTIIRRVILCISVLMILYGAVRLCIYISEYHSSQETSQELRDLKAEAENARETRPENAETAAPPAETAAPVKGDSAAVRTPEPEAAPTKQPEATGSPAILQPVEYPNGLKVSATIRKLREKSEDIIGWITMDDLSEAVVLRDNTFFLDHDALGRKNSNGAIFMDEDTNLLTRPYTIMLYGHNMKTGAMFGNLRKYEKQSYLSQHQIFSLETLYEEGQYAIFAVAQISVTPGTSRFVNLYDIRSSERAARQEALQTLIKRSMHGVTLDVNEEDQLVLLVTCVGDDDERLIVAARRLRDGERPGSLNLRFQ